MEIMQNKKKIYFLTAALFALFVSAQPPGKGYQLMFEENFSGDTLNTAMWRYRIDHRVGMGYMDGYDRAENVRVANGMLYIDCRQELLDGKQVSTGGGIISKKDFGYGYYECLSKPFMDGSGVHTSFWQRGSYTPNNSVFEIDSYEIDSKNDLATNNLYMVLGDKARPGVPWPHRAQIPFTTDKEGWFLDGYEYTPDGIIFYDNGKQVARADWKELNAAQAVWLTALNGVGTVDKDKQPCSSVFKYFRFYAKDYPGVNILPNGNFEFNQDKIDAAQPMCWTPIGSADAVQVVRGDAVRDNYKLHLGSQENAFNVVLRQRLSFIMDGEYVLSAMVRSSGGMHKAALVAAPTDDLFTGAVSVNIPQSDKWTKISVPVKVVNHEVYIYIVGIGEHAQWLDIDDVNFMKPLPAGVKPKAAVPFCLFKKAAWQLADYEPIHFPGDKRFYFFDRNVGLGDTISVCFTLNASEMANTTPIARIPKSGTSGWSVMLTANGGLIFRIGSIENHTDVYAKGVYKVGKPVRVACVFEHGTALVYADGRLIKRQRGIVQNTWDKTAAGRLGSVGKSYEAVGEVVMQVAGSDKETKSMKNFRGSLYRVKIFNNSATE